MIVKTKHNDICCNIYRDKEGISEKIKFYRIIATNKDECEMGHANFKLKDNGDVWLYHIKTEDSFLHQGVGQAMLDAMEVFCVKNSYTHIEGAFYPENEYAEIFYKNNNYSIFEDCYSYFISKHLKPSKVITETSQKIEGEMTVFDYKDYLEKKSTQQETQTILENISQRQDTQEQNKNIDLTKNEKSTQLKQTFQTL